ncbi:unnamed protein product [Notodromas monacha]|uniref:B(0,+)-type amino acid transporter 1 n=1 Tax=Notodromas monacha TaxID=399045 RepID=A0A7R9BLF8_9CRUS|nr:unnamed protein product [Notodromas monacha]CAG0917653.1 unnamed protein product [Notodromas monacha]
MYLAVSLPTVLAAFINCYNVKLATRVQTFFTGAKLLAIVIIVIGGIYKIAEGHGENLIPDFEKTGDIGNLASAFYSGLWAYDGWNNMNFVTEEIENPHVNFISRNLPRAIMIALPLVTLCYTLVNIAYLSVMTPAEIIASKAVAVTFGERVLGKAAFIMPLAVAFSTFGAANGSAFTIGRLVLMSYAAAKEGHMVDVLAYVNVKSLSPSPAIVFNAILAVTMIMTGDIRNLIDFVSFTTWIFYGLSMVSLMIMRRTKKDTRRPYKGDAQQVPNK